MKSAAKQFQILIIFSLTDLEANAERDLSFLQRSRFLLRLQFWT